VTKFIKTSLFLPFILHFYHKYLIAAPPRGREVFVVLAISAFGLTGCGSRLFSQTPGA
jgi:hypothetical protein